MIRISVILPASLLLVLTHIVSAEELTVYEKEFNKCLSNGGAGTYEECFREQFERCVIDQSSSLGCLNLRPLPADWPTVHYFGDDSTANIKDLLFSRKDTTLRWRGGIYVPTPAERYLAETSQSGL